MKEEQGDQVRGKTLRYVSRGGLKLEKATACWPISLEGHHLCRYLEPPPVALPTVCCKMEPVKVHAVDVGYNQLDYRLRTHPQVV